MGKDGDERDFLLEEYSANCANLGQNRVDYARMENVPKRTKDGLL
jgi:hypothetical protein